MGAIASFIKSHQTILGMIEKAAIDELLHLLKALYPNDPVILEIADKVVAELEKLQGLKS